MKKREYGGTAWALGCPCLPDCPDRGAGCHGRCAAYLAYERRANELRQRRVAEVQADTIKRENGRTILRGRKA